MSISLNDHERRIKTLENVINGTVKNIRYIKSENNGKTFKFPDKNWNIAIISMVTDRYKEAAPTWVIKNSVPSYFCYGLDYNNYMECDYYKDSINSIINRHYNMISLDILLLKIYYIFRYNIYNKFILRINSTFDNFVNIFTSFDLFGSFKRSVLRLTNHITSQNEFYYLREVNYDMEIKSNILYYKILVLCYILLKQIFVYFSLLVDMEFYFYHFMGGEKI